MSLVLACAAPLQSLAAVFSSPCHHSHAGGEMHEHGDTQPDQHDKAHGCAACAACCAGAAISYSFQVAMAASRADSVAPRALASFAGAPPARLDRPPR
jgi:NAD-dependent dihydropyrimidine dehydrogenase PreA subunit